MNTELTEQIEQYAQKLKDVSSLLFIDYFFCLKVAEENNPLCCFVYPEKNQMLLIFSGF